jgi:hypothetical protein
MSDWLFWYLTLLQVAALIRIYQVLRTRKQGIEDA